MLAAMKSFMGSVNEKAMREALKHDMALPEMSTAGSPSHNEHSASPSQWLTATSLVKSDGSGQLKNQCATNRHAAPNWPNITKLTPFSFSLQAPGTAWYTKRFFFGGLVGWSLIEAIWPLISSAEHCRVGRQGLTSRRDMASQTWKFTDEKRSKFQIYEINTIKIQ